MSIRVSPAESNWVARCVACHERRATLRANVGGEYPYALALCDLCAADLSTLLVRQLERHALDRLAAPAALEYDTNGAKLRAILVEAHRQTGKPIPDWLRGPAAREFLEDL